ncbi:MAG: ATP-binding protein, partial [Chloroflexi bacterium]|nr:ATP-binding protein [Chloroflexota bacterium]
ELYTSQRLTQSIIDTSPTVIYIYNLHLRQTVYMSAQAASMLGYTDNEFQLFRTNMTAQLMHPEDQLQRNQYFQRFNLLGDNEILEIEYRMRHKNGEWRWLVSRDTIFQRTAEGQPLEILGVALDITIRKQAEGALQELNTALEQRVWERTTELERSNRELDQFAYVASHDLKAPLRAINYLAEWIRTDAAEILPPASQTHLVTLQGRIKRMEALLNDLLAYSRAGRQRHELEQVDTADLIKNVVDLLSPPPGFTITVESNLPTMPLERVPLETVFRNLIGNAIKHHNDPDTGSVCIAAQEQAQLIEFSVSDNGPGIDPAFHERIFQIFQTLKARDEVEGSGMGLAVVKKTVEHRGGTIRVESSAGQGATFRFTWPKSVG